jgi:hypothetical protein
MEIESEVAIELSMESRRVEAAFPLRLVAHTPEQDNGEAD